MYHEKANIQTVNSETGEIMALHCVEMRITRWYV